MRASLIGLMFPTRVRLSSSFSSVPWKSASRFQAMQRRQEDYLGLLRNNLPAFQEAFGSRLTNATTSRTSASTSDQAQDREKNTEAKAEDNVPHASPAPAAAATRPEEKPARELGLLRNIPRTVLRSIVATTGNGDRATSGPLHEIPPNWVAETTAALEAMLEGVVHLDQIRANDYFLSACMHPSYLAQQTVNMLPLGRQRRAARAAAEQAAMPPELLRAGEASLRVLAELSWLHDQHLPRWESVGMGGDGALRRRNQPLGPPPLVAPPLTEDRVLSTAMRCGLAPCVLFSEAFLTASTAAAPQTLTWVSGHDGDDTKSWRIPTSVLGEAFTALCGAIDLVGGTEAVATFLDRWIPPTVREAAREPVECEVDHMPRRL